jgi:hypothetical protein
MQTFVFTVGGVALLALIAFEVYATVLHSTAHFGPIGERLNRAVWKVACFVANRMARTRRHRFLNAVGPLLMPMLIVIFVVILVVAFAFLYYPRMPAQFIYSNRPESNEFMDAIYFSGVTLTSVGYGDIVPRTNAMRLVAMTESASGLALISLGIAYLLMIYGALERKRAVALSFYHQAGEGADAAGYIAHHFVEGQFYGLRESMREATRDLQELLEAHVEHPVINYFHPVEVYKGFPRIIFLLLETCAIIGATLDSSIYSDFRNYPEVRTLEANTRYVLDELVSSLDLERREEKRDDERPADEERWLRRYRLNLKRLADAGIKTRNEVDGGFEEYRAQRNDWEDKLQLLSNYLGYDWEEVTGDRDPDYAVNEEKEEPQTEGRGPGIRGR